MSATAEREKALSVLLGRRVPQVGDRCAFVFGGRPMRIATGAVVRASDSGKTVWVRFDGEARHRHGWRWRSGGRYPFRRSAKFGVWKIISVDRPASGSLSFGWDEDE